MARAILIQRQSAADLLDGAAMLCSFACMAHCVVLPLLVLALPVLATWFFIPESIHLWLLALAAPATGTALLLGYWQHRQGMPIIAGAAGLILLGAATFFEGRPEIGLTLAGSILIASAHLLNLHLRRRCCSIS